MLGIEICVDVPNLAHGIRYYEDAFGFSTVSEHYLGAAVLAASAVRITLLEKDAQTQASPDTGTYDARGLN
jgi:hypothetical protein